MSLTIAKDPETDAGVFGTADLSIGRLGCVALIVLLALSVRLYNIGTDSLWIDEVYQVNLAKLSVATQIAQYRPDAAYHGRDQAPLSPIVTRLLLPETEATSGPALTADGWTAARVRLPSAIFGALSVLALFVVARQLFSYEVAVVTALLLSISPLHVWYSQEARWYAQWELFVTLSYLSLLRFFVTSRRGALWCYAAATCANLYAFIFNAFVMAAQLMTALRPASSAATLREGRFLKLGLAQLITVLLAAPIVWVTLADLGGDSGSPRPASILELPYTAYAFSVGFSFGPTLAELHARPGLGEVLSRHPEILAVAVVFGFLALRGLREIARNGSAASVVLPWLFVPPLLCVAVGFFTGITYEIRYVLASLSPYLLVVSVGIFSLSTHWIRALAAACVVLICLASLSNVYWEARYDREDARGAVAHMRQAGGGEHVVVVATRQFELALEYYAGQNELDVVTCEEVTGVARGKAFIDTRRPAWLAISRDWWGEADACLEALTGDGYSVVERSRYAGIELVRLAPERS